MPSTATRWTTDEIQSLSALRTTLREAFEAGVHRQALSQLLGSELKRPGGRRLMFVEEIQRAIDDGEPPHDSERSTGNSLQGAGELPADQIDTNPFQPRVHFEEAKLEELATSIEENGLLQPITVRRSPEDAGRFQLVAGERRLRAMRRLGWERVPAIVRDYSDRQMAVLGLVENIQRADISPVEEARAYSRYLEMTGETQTSLAREVGKTQGHVSNRMRLLGLTEGLLQRIDDGVIAHSHARDLILPFHVLDSERWCSLCEAFEDAFGPTTNPLSETEIWDAVRTTAGGISRPLSNNAIVWKIDGQHQIYSVPDRIAELHDEECRCKGPAYRWEKSSRKAARCFDPAWWDSALRRIREEADQEREAQQAQTPADTSPEKETAPPAPLEWPDRSLPVPTSKVGELGGMLELLKLGEEASAHVDVSAIPTECLYWLEQDGSPPLLVYAYGDANRWEIENPVIHEGRRLLRERIRGAEEAAWAQARERADESQLDSDALLGLIPYLSWTEHYELAEYADRAGVPFPAHEDRPLDTLDRWLSWISDHPDPFARLLAVFAARLNDEDYPLELDETIAADVARENTERLFALIPQPASS